MLVTNNLKMFNEVVDDFFKQLKPGDVVLLNGEIGVGKTTFVKQIAVNLQITDIVTSPTYTILKTYDNKLCHIDAYRLSDEDLELDSYIEQGYIVFIEWSENITDYLTKVDYHINISYSSNEEERIIEIKEI